MEKKKFDYAEFSEIDEVSEKDYKKLKKFYAIRRTINLPRKNGKRYKIKLIDDETK